MKIRTLPVAQEKQLWPAFLLVMLVICYAVTAITPPFQAPDEFDHLKRAYMFGHGQIVLASPGSGAPSGGNVDAGLIEYMNSFVPLAGKADRKISAGVLAQAGSVRWKGEEVFQSPTGTAYYFPVMYTPQAMGLLAGKLLNLSVGQSYRIARFLTLFTCLALIYLACLIFPPPPVLLAVLALPMNLFLLSAPTLDGMAISTAVVAFATFMRIESDRAASTRVVVIFLTSVLLLTACRANAAPFLALPFAAWWTLRDRRVLLGGVFVALFVVAWTLYTMKATVYPPGPRHIDHTARLISYVVHPDRFLKILYATLANSGVRDYYWQSFLGNFGWLDTPLKLSDYRIITLLLAASAVFSISMQAIAGQRVGRGLLAISAVATILMTYLAMLVQWTVGDSDIIQGVQGRYFAIPAIACAFSFAGQSKPPSSMLRSLAYGAVAVMLAVGTYTMTKTLVARYYTTSGQAEASGESSRLSPTAPLTTSAPIVLHLSAAQASDPIPIDRLDIMFGTYMHEHSGRAELRLTTLGGTALTIPFELKSLVDNAYHEFILDGKPYVRAEITSREGGAGVSVWESRQDGEPPTACTVIYGHDESLKYTQGCPTP